MKHIYLKQFALLILLAFSTVSVSMIDTTNVSAGTEATTEACSGTEGSRPSPRASDYCMTGETIESQNRRNRNCGEDEIETSYIWGGTNCVPKNSDSADVTRSPMYALLTDFLKFFSALVGVAVAGGIIVGGITWSTSQGNPGQVQKAITIITNSIIGLIMYLLMFAIINFLVPGGLFV